MAGQSFSVINNINSYAAQQNLGFSRMGMDSSLAKMSSGLRINEAGDDAAGLAIGSALKADYTALSQGVRNANEGMGIVQVADGALSRMNDMLARATQLATQAASGTVGTQERQTINTEYQQILQEIDRVTGTANFKGENLFSQTEPVVKRIAVGDTQIQSNINISIGGAGGVGTSSLGLSGTTLATPEGAQSALSLIRDATQNVAEMRGSLGAQENRLVNSIGILQVQSQNILAAESSIMDTNMAAEVSNLTKNKILMQSGMASLAQANATNQMVLQLFR
jgi:flagellin